MYNNAYLGNSNGKAKSVKKAYLGINGKSNQELIKEQFEIAEYSLIYMYIYEFINRYTYYVGDGGFYDLNIL